MPGDLCTAPRIISLSPLSLATDLTDEILRASGLWLGTRTGAGGIATLSESFFGRSPWLKTNLKIMISKIIENNSSGHTDLMFDQPYDLLEVVAFSTEKTIFSREKQAF